MAHEDLVADRDFWKKRALASEQERDEYVRLRDEWATAAQQARARVAELEAGINALADKWEWTYVGYVRRFLVPALRALTEKGD